MQTVLAIYFAGAILGSAVLLLAAFQGYRREPRELWPPLRDETMGQSTEPFDAAQSTDVGTAAGVALKRVTSRLRDRDTELDVAIRPGLRVRDSGHQLADVLEQMLIAMAGGRHRRLLLSAAMHGNQVVIAVTNDAPRADLQTLRSSMQDLAVKMALRGASLEAEVLPGHGAKVVLRLTVAGSRAESPARETADTVSAAQARAPGSATISGTPAISP